MTIENLSLQNLFRSEALAFPKYTLGEPVEATRLHQNETLGLDDSEREEFARVLADAVRTGEAVNTYPSLEPSRLLRAYGSALDVPASHIEVTSGSSQALTLIAEALFGPGRTVALTTPSFSLYGSLARLHGSAVCEISLDANFRFTREAFFQKDVLESQVALVCSPNNPTGTVCPSDILLEFAENYRGVLIVDEAYIEFCRDAGVVSFIQQALSRRNVIVLRTLSKAWGLAGLRVGALVACPEVVSIFRALKPPYSIAWPSEVLAAHVLETKKANVAKRIDLVLRQRNELSEILSRSTKIELLTHSQANFVFFKSPVAAELERHCLADGFLVRRYGAGRLANAVRISMPPVERFRHLKDVLKGVLE
ncbi:MAG: hypothetical protein RIR26_195 [Pseudomonadota bacterium]|jgi:histidinol-phosphate aminotransferase